MLAGPQASDDGPVSASYLAYGALALQIMLPRMSGFAWFWGFKLKLSHLCGKHFPVESSPQPNRAFIFFSLTTKPVLLLEWYVHVHVCVYLSAYRHQ